MTTPIVFKNSDTFYKQALELTSDYLNPWPTKRLRVLNDANEAIWEKNSPSLLLTVLKVITYCTIVIPLIVFVAHLVLSEEYTIRKAGDPNLSSEVKQALFEESPVKKLWQLFKCADESLLEFPQEALFLKDTKILFLIKLWESSPNTLHKKGMEYDTDHHPKILYQGNFERLDTILAKHELHLQPITNIILDKEGHEWNYIYGKGLMPVDWKFDKNAPSTELTSEQLSQLTEKYANGDKSKCFVQVITMEEEEAPHPWLEKLYKMRPRHVAFHFISNDGKLYSTGLEAHRLRETLPQILITQPASFSRVDFEETAPFHKKYVTTFPLEPEMFRQVTSELDQACKTDLIRCHSRHRNCGFISQSLINRMEIKVDCKTSLTGIIAKTLPDCDIRIPEIVKQCLSVIFFPITYVLDQVYLFLHALLALSLGTNKQLPDMKEGDANELPEFIRPMHDPQGEIDCTNWCDPSQLDIYYPALVTEWQVSHPNTQVFEYKKGAPQFNIV